MEPVVLFSKSTGLQTLVPDNSIDYDSNSGVSALALAINVDIDNAGNIRLTQSGYNKFESGNFHSLWRDTGDAFVGEGTNLYKVNTDKSLHLIRDDMQGNYIDFFQLGNETYYGNGHQHGKIFNSTNYSWPTSDRLATKTLRHLENTPPFDHLAIADNRIYFSIGNILYWTELGLYGLYDPIENHIPFGSNVRMIRPVDGGLFLSTENWTWFLYGHDPYSFRQSYQPVGPPAHEWSVCPQHRDASEIRLNSSGKCYFWTCDDGLACGTPNGDIIIMNKDSLIYPKANRGASLLYGDQLLHVLWKI